MNPITCDQVYLGESPFGKGVFAKRNFLRGEIVETGIMTVMKNVCGVENPHLFTWSDDKKTWAAGSGFLPFYNHADENEANIKKAGNLQNNTMVIYALRDIKKDEELRNTYHSKKWRKCFQSF
tara:strand:+ start:240 stop:608 length:369 start_codon:yes stop_codon:yes gene_type:complete